MSIRVLILVFAILAISNCKSLRFLTKEEAANSTVTPVTIEEMQGKFNVMVSSLQQVESKLESHSSEIFKESEKLRDEAKRNQAELLKIKEEINLITSTPVISPEDQKSSANAEKTAPKPSTTATKLATPQSNAVSDKKPEVKQPATKVVAEVKVL